MTAAAFSRPAAAPHAPPRPTSRPPKAAKADILMWMVLMYTWVSIWRYQDVVPFLGKIKMPLVVQFSVALFFIADQSPARKIKWIKSPLSNMLLAFLAIMFLGIPTSLWPSMGLTFILREYIPYLVVMVILATSVRSFADLEWYAFAHLASAAFFALYAYLFCPLDWNGRLIGVPFYDANDFALLMNCTLPFAIFFLRPSVKLWKKLFAIGAIALFVLMIIRTGSRGGFLGMSTITIFVLLRYTAIPKKYRIWAVVAGFLVMMGFGSDRYWKMMQTILAPKNDYNMTDETGRKKVWLRGISYMMHRPITGVGVRAFPTAEGQLSPVARRYAEMGRGIKWSVAHNSFVEVGAELGVFALGVFVSMIGYSIYAMGTLKVARRKVPWVTDEERAFGQSLIGTLMGFCVSGFFVSAEYFSYVYITFGFVLGFSALLRKRAMTQPWPVPGAPPQGPQGTPGQAPPGHGPPPPPRPARRPHWQRPQWIPGGS